ncbi:MAG TPA: tetratricopeptide repeat protein [Chitinophagaceae bacterium]|nr:tetratricopeptide repeat protein [Chitinophagaceae bacterium]
MKQVVRWAFCCTLAAGLLSCHFSGPVVNQTDVADSLYNSGQLRPYTDSIRLYPRNALYYFKRSELLYNLQQFVLSRNDLLRASLLNPQEPGFYYALGEVNLALHSLDSARHDYNKAMELDKGDQQIRLRLADVLFLLKEDGLSRLELDTLLRVDPGNAEGHGLISQVYEDQGDTARAIGEMERAVKLSPQNYDALMAMGDLYSAVHQPKAVDFYHKAYLLDTTQEEPLYAMGLYYHKMQQDDQAIAVLKQCIGTNHYYPGSYLELGKIYFQHAQIENALKMFNLATKVDPMNAQAYYQMGLCNESAGKRQQARTDYRQAYALDNHMNEAKAALNRLK